MKPYGKILYRQSLIYYLIIGMFLLSACGDGTDRSSGAGSDSLTAISTDSMKKINPLLILPPDSEYTGSYIDRYPNGIVKYTGYFRFGERHGQWMSFYPSGEMWSEMHYEKGLRHGPNVTYFENGKKRYEGVYRNDKQDSIWCYYDTAGNLAERVLFRENRMVKRLEAESSR